jgi:hypothetical protein
LNMGLCEAAPNKQSGAHDELPELKYSNEELRENLHHFEKKFPFSRFNIKDF